MKNRLSGLIVNAIEEYDRGELRFHGVDEAEYIAKHIRNDVIVLPIKCSDELIEELSNYCSNRCVDEL